MVPLAILALCLPTVLCLYENMPYTTIVETGSDISKLSTSAGSLSWTSPTINDQLHEVSSFQTSLLMGSKDKMG